ncbi:YkgJ family cysteine cluster protein [Pararobbsia silviterrae]|nr:YkgJ family cysteine cluster protein [Pararobbsia silviterrae]
MCGKCCQDLRLPLSVAESVSWIRRGGTLEVFCDAVPWPVEPAADDVPAQHKRRVSFAAASGSQPIRVIVTLVAAFDGPCPNLRDDMRCDIYDERPRVCRIYPAEVVPYLKFVPANKLCPPEAWSATHPPFEQNGRIFDAETAEIIRQSRETTAQDADVKQRVMALLGFTAAAFSNEGFVIYTPDPAAALDALETAIAAASSPMSIEAIHDWTFVSNQQETVEALRSIKAKATASDPHDPQEGPAFQYLGFRPAQSASH